MASNSSLEQAIDKILVKTEKEILSDLEKTGSDSKNILDNALPKLQQEYDKIISDGKKEADKIEKQIVGSSDIELRNKQLLLLEEAVDKVFSKALDQIANVDRNDDYSNLIKTLLKESTNVLGTSEITVNTNTKDKDIVQSMLSQFPGSELGSDSIDCLGGIIVKSKDGSMTFDNTIDAKIERLKPLIRKEIASKFGVGN
ncbi:MAG: V-type ATP synthase subunit E family protein [Nitrosopumilus sp.]|nr:V-type ATP synthase subunit E family protein [Nitrosopumilus sp.]MDH3736706.1 V-type ATP synthase subunit E family protein [Nitrosopumilus sp.]MDH3822116.1 V-type ATP synthase subunit E family protein [Nitrosopumilus sp.]